MSWIPWDLGRLSAAEVREFFESAFVVAPEGLPWVWGCALALGLALCFAGSRATALVLFGLGFLLTGPPAAELCGRWDVLEGIPVAGAFVCGGLVGGGAGLAVYGVAVLGAGLAIGALVTLIVLRLFGWEMQGQLFSLPALGAAAIALLLRRWLFTLASGFGGAWIATTALHEGLAGENGVVRYLEDPGGTLSSHMATPVLIFGWAALGVTGTLVQVRLGRRDKLRKQQQADELAELRAAKARA